MTDKVALQNVIARKPEVKRLLDFADQLRISRWKNKSHVTRYCLSETYNSYFHNELTTIFDWDVPEDREGYDLVSMTISHTLPRCHGCDCVPQEQRVKSRDFYSWLFEQHYDLTKSAKQKRDRFNVLKQKPEFIEFVSGLLEEQNYLCFYCEGKLGWRYHIDHVVPLSRGGSNNTGNMVLSCSRCNLKKNDTVEYAFSLDPEYVDWIEVEFKEGVWLPMLHH